MNFAFTEEQDALRATVRRFCEERSPSAEVRRLIGTLERDGVNGNSSLPRDPAFYAFHRSLEAYRKSFADGNAAIVLDENDPFLEYLRNDR